MFENKTAMKRSIANLLATPIIFTAVSTNVQPGVHGSSRSKPNATSTIPGRNTVPLDLDDTLTTLDISHGKETLAAPLCLKPTSDSFDQQFKLMSASSRHG